MDFEEGGTVLKILYATLGKRWTRVIVWALALAALLAASRWAIESVEWFATRFGWDTFSWGTILIAFGGSIASALMLMAFGLSLGVILSLLIRLGLASVMHARVGSAIDKVLDLISNVSEHINTAEDIYNVYRIREDAEALRRDWQKSFIVKVVGWVAPPRKIREQKAEHKNKDRQNG